MKRLRWLFVGLFLSLATLVGAQDKETVRQLQKFVRAYRYLDQL